MSIILIGQPNDTLSNVLVEEVVLSDIRSLRPLPWTHQTDTIRLTDAFQPSLRNALQKQPGMVVFNGENFAQDIRLSIRGYGSRSAFGIRGIKIYQDGIPLTTPDGTTQMDEVSVFDVQEMDYIRSGMAARLGNSAGGTIALKSADYFDGWQALAGGNQFGTYNLGAKYGVQTLKTSNVISVNHQYFRGRRQHAFAQNTTLYNKTRFFVNQKWELKALLGAYTSPLGDDPGALTHKEFDTDPYEANPRNLTFQSGESVQGLMLAGISEYFINEQSMWISKVYYRKRDFQAKLPFETNGWVKLNRDFVGLANVLEYQQSTTLKWSFGQALEYQNDQRKLSVNNNGTQGNLLADQDERVINLGLFEHLQWSLKKWSLHQLLRWDLNDLKINDQFLSNGIQNGQQSFRNLNGSFGTAYEINKKIQVYANINSAFEMPTLNELANNPESVVGFNQTLQPEKSLQSELGTTTIWSHHWKAQIAFFFIRIQDQIIGYEQASTPGKTYYRNAGKTNRSGSEFTMNYKNKNTYLDLNYTWSNFKYQSYLVNDTDLKGNVQPLIPDHKVSVRIGASILKYLMADLLFIYNSKMWLNDANTDKVGDIKELQFSITSSPKVSSNFTFGIQVNNMFGWLNYSNFRANAAFNRYYEANSPMNFGIFAKGSWTK